VPYLFTDFLWLRQGRGIQQRPDADPGRSTSYRAWLIFLATVPLLLLRWPVAPLQLAFGITGAMLLPLLALTLLLMNNRRSWVGSYRTGFAVNVVLGIALAFFGYVGVAEVGRMLMAR
jgi:hypothetical protein